MSGGRKCLFEPALLSAPLALRLLPFDRWSSRVPLRDGAPASGTLLVKRRGVVPTGERACGQL